MTPQPDLLETLRRKQLQDALTQASVAQTPAAPALPPQPPATVTLPSMKEAPNASDQYTAMLSQEPKLADYHPSLGRKIGSIAAGIGEGLLTRNPLAGMKVAEDVKYGPFNQREKEFQQQLAQKKTAAEEGRTQAESGAKVEAETSRAGAEKERGEAEKSRRQYIGAEQRALTPGTPEFEGKETITKLQHPDTEVLEPKDTYSFDLLDGTKVTNASRVHDKNTGEFHYVTDNGEKISAGAMAPGSLKKTTQPTERMAQTSMGAKIQGYREAHNGEYPPTELIDEWEKNSAVAKETPALKESRTASAHLSEKKAEGATPEEIQNAITFQNSNPAQYGNYLKNLPEMKKRDVLAQVPPTALPPGADQTNYSNARTTLNHAKSLRQMLQDPQIQANLGPILGRIQSAEGQIGGAPSGNVDPQKEQAFLSLLTQNMLWEARNLGGSRPAWQLVQMIKTTSPKSSQVVERFLGALDAEEKSATNRMEGIINTGQPGQTSGSFKIIKKGE